MKKSMYKKIICSIALALLLGVCGTASAEYMWFSDADGLWSNTALWNPVGTPGTGTSAILDCGATSEIASGTSPSIWDLYVSSWDGETSTLNITGGSLTTAYSASLGCYQSADNGVMNVSAGSTVTVGEHLRVGWTGSGTLNMNGGTIDVAQYLVVAFPWASTAGGHLNLNAGTITATNLAMDNSLGVIDISAGKLRLLGDWTSTLGDCVTAGSLKGYGGAGTVNMEIVSGYTEVTATIPEPATMILLSLGMLAVLSMNRQLVVGI